MSLVAKENKFIEDFINEYLKTSRVPSQHLSILIELVEDTSDLSDENRTKLRKALTSQLPNNTFDWNNRENLTEALAPLLVYNPKQPIVLQIQRICLTKQFFLKQVGLPADMVFIPRWYHATRAVEAILTSSQIEVRHEKLFKGAWVSTQREPDFGPYVLSLSERIEQIDPRASIHFEHSHSRWRGLGHTIDLKTTEGNSQLALVGIPESVIGTAKKIQQNSLVRILQQQGFPNVAVLPVEQVDFMQKEVSETLGCPNLSDQWWGLGRAYSKHQQHLHETIQALNLDPNLFRLDEDPTNNQAKIAKMIQIAALPFYKEILPQYPSYQTDKKNVRVDLPSHSEREFNALKEAVEQNERPARDIYGAIHCVRLTLWSQLLTRVYEQLERPSIEQPILLAISSSYQDIARENEGVDRWSEESSEALQTLLTHTDMTFQETEMYVTAIKGNHPKKQSPSSDVQRILYDAQLLELMRIQDKRGFKKKNLFFYHFDKIQKPFCDQLIKEVGDFIALTENPHVRNYLEHHSEDCYGDMVRFLFAMHKKEEARFPLLTQILARDMKGLLTTPETNVSQYLLDLTIKSIDL